ncbi:FAD-dependent oxidoreductase [Jatrophihabitans sp. DSM 45814]
MRHTTTNRPATEQTNSRREGSTADVIILGGGGAGLSAAVSAAENGASVILLQKAPTVGGTTAMSVGAFTAAGTSLQKKAGVADSVDEFIADIQTANGPLDSRENRQLRQLFAEQAAPTMEWLIGMGVRFLGPFSVAPNRHPRMHNVLPNSRSFTAALAVRARKLGVRIETDRRAEELLTDDNDGVIGVRAGSECYYAAKGVVIATGDYTAATDLVSAELGGSAGTATAANPDNTGDGHLLGRSVGGVTLGMDSAAESLRYLPRKRRDIIKGMPSFPWFSRLAAPFARHVPRPLFEFMAKGALVGWFAPSAAMYEAGAIQIDAATGRRMTDETKRAELSRSVGKHGDRSYLVLDAKIAREFSRGGQPVAAFPGIARAYLEDVRRRRRDVITEAATIEELARKLGVSNLPETVGRWNFAVTKGSDDEFGREALGAGIKEGPFAALGPMASVAMLTNGGLAIDVQFRVLDADGKPIGGLYAAGSAGQGGLLLQLEGLHIAWAHTSGRLAGRSAALAKG